MNTKNLPTVADCKPGLWAKLSNGWIVGPIIETEFDGVYVAFADGTWQLDLIDQREVDKSSSRLVVKVFQPFSNEIAGPELKHKCTHLANLLEDPHPGLSTWNEAVKEAVAEVDRTSFPWKEEK